MPALDELERGFEARAARPGVRSSGACSCSRTTSAARRRSTSPSACRKQVGFSVWLKREDLCHTGAHKMNNVLGQVLLAKRMGKPRVIAETGAGQHGVATATGARAARAASARCSWAPKTCGARRRTCGACTCSAPRCTPVQSGSRTLKDAMNEAMRDWVTNVADTYYCVGTVAGPHPYPAIVREFQRVISDEAKQQILQKTRPLARRGGRVRRRRLERDRHVRRVHPAPEVR